MSPTRSWCARFRARVQSLDSSCAVTASSSPDECGRQLAVADLVRVPRQSGDRRRQTLFDASGRPIPNFVPGESLLQFFPAVRNAALSVDNHSAFVQDHWSVTGRLSADLGARFEDVKPVSTGDCARCAAGAVGRVQRVRQPQADRVEHHGQSESGRRRRQSRPRDQVQHPGVPAGLLRRVAGRPDLARGVRVPLLDRAIHPGPSRAEDSRCF